VRCRPVHDRGAAARARHGGRSAGRLERDGRWGQEHRGPNGRRNAAVRDAATELAVKTRSPRTLRGMTLIEAMIAITILTIVTTLVYGGFTQTMRNKSRVEDQSDRAHVIRVAMERIVRELSSAFVSIHVNPNATLRSMLTCFHGYREGGASRIDFTS